MDDKEDFDRRPKLQSIFEATMIIFIILGLFIFYFSLILVQAIMNWIDMSVFSNFADRKLSWLLLLIIMPTIGTPIYLLWKYACSKLGYNPHTFSTIKKDRNIFNTE